MEERKPKRYALNIGMSKTSDHYGQSQSFPSAKKSSIFMSDFFGEKQLKFDESKLLRNEKATILAFEETINGWSKKLIAGDTLVITFCGHTFKVKKDSNLINASFEDKGWGLFDRVLFHFEIWEILEKIDAGVKVVIIADSCYSDIIGIDQKSKRLEIIDLAFTFESKSEVYNEVLRRSGKISHHKIKSSVVIISSSGSKDEIVAGYSNTETTMFSYAFKQAIEYFEKPENIEKHLFTLTNLYDLITWNIFTIYAQQYGELKTLHKAKRTHPKWHYHQGLINTRIRNSYPAFN